MATQCPSLCPTSPQYFNCSWSKLLIKPGLSCLWWHYRYPSHLSDYLVCAKKQKLRRVYRILWGEPHCTTVVLVCLPLQNSHFVCGWLLRWSNIWNLHSTWTRSHLLHCPTHQKALPFQHTAIGELYLRCGYSNHLHSQQSVPRLIIGLYLYILYSLFLAWPFILCLGLQRGLHDHLLGEQLQEGEGANESEGNPQRKLGRE